MDQTPSRQVDFLAVTNRVSVICSSDQTNYLAKVPKDPPERYNT